MRYGEIKKTDVANGPGIRVSLFVSGCRHRCPDCFNRVTWDFDYGSEFTDSTENEILSLLDKSYIRGLTLIGGEPMEPENQTALLKLVQRVKARFPDKDIWCYSGFTFEQLLGGSRAATKEARALLSLMDVLVDGRFEKDKKNLMLRFRGSENQRIIDLHKSLAANSPVLLNI